jgi:hypothetical protein
MNDPVGLAYVRSPLLSHALLSDATTDAVARVASDPGSIIIQVEGK